MRRIALLLAAFAIACGRAPDAGERVAHTTSRFTSREATLLDFELDGAIAAETDDLDAVRSLIGVQLTYTIGALNAESSVPRAAKAAVSAIAKAPDGTFRYHAKLPVAWGAPDLPASYVLTLPRRVAPADEAAFATKYGATCVDSEAGPPPVQPSLLFLHFRPHLPSCVLAPSDVVTVNANVTRSPENQTGKYPEYDRIWDDQTLNVVALFSRADTEEATGDDDEGLRAYAKFTSDLRAYFGIAGDAMPIVKALPDGRTVHVDARMVEHALDESPGIDDWYADRTSDADLILYNGHAGLGENVRSLVRKGRFRRGQYVILSLNACDTFAYIDDTLAARRAALNPDDPAGTKYLDVISNVMPGYFSDGPTMSLTLIRALIDPPATYDDILARLDPAQVANVTGEEDNSFVPAHVESSPAPAPGDWGLPPDPPDDDDEHAAASAKRTASTSCASSPGAASASPRFALVPLFALLACGLARRWRARYAGAA